MAHFFVLDLTYIADLSEVDAHMDEHRAFLQRHYDNGTFLASGRKEPRVGGVILATGSREQVERAVFEDPFLVAGLVRYDITEFVPSTTCAALAAFRDAG